MVYLKRFDTVAHYRTAEDKVGMCKRILFTLDAPAMAEQAFSPALTFAERFDSELILLRVVSPLAKSYRPGPGSVAAIESGEKALVQEVTGHLDDIAGQIRDSGLSVQVPRQRAIPDLFCNR